MRMVKFWSIILLTVMMLPVMVACGGDDDDIDGGGITYTEAEIFDILNGQWAIKGEINTEDQNGEKRKADYSGKITFSVSGKNHYVSDLSDITMVDDGTKKLNFLRNFIRVGSSTFKDYLAYRVLKKDSKTYLCFQSYLGDNGCLNYQILSLNKNSFKLVLDYNVYSDNKNLGRIYMTMISQ